MVWFLNWLSIWLIMLGCNDLRMGLMLLELFLLLGGYWVLFLWWLLIWWCGLVLIGFGLFFIRSWLFLIFWMFCLMIWLLVWMCWGCSCVCCIGVGIWWCVVGLSFVSCYLLKFGFEYSIWCLSWNVGLRILICSLMYWLLLILMVVWIYVCEFKLLILDLRDRWLMMDMVVLLKVFRCIWVDILVWMLDLVVNCVSIRLLVMNLVIILIGWCVILLNIVVKVNVLCSGLFGLRRMICDEWWDN